MRAKLLSFFILCGILSLLSVAAAHQARAGLIRVESESFLSGRNGSDYRFELPVREFMAGSYVSEKRNVEVNTNFSMDWNPTHSKRGVELYLMDFNYEAVPDLLAVRAGRLFDSHYSIGTNTLDAVAAEMFFLQKQLRVGGYIGIERKLETENFGSLGSLRGGNIHFTQSSMTPLSLTAKFQQRTFPTDRLMDDENLVQLAGMKPFAGSLSPEFLFDSTYHLGHHNMERLETGVNLYPSLRASSHLKFLTFNLRNNEGPIQPIYSIFSTGRLYEALGQFETQLHPSLIGSLSFAYDDYPSSVLKRSQGYRAELEFRFLPESGSLTNTSYFFKSYGGEVYGDRIRLGQFMSRKFELFELADVTYYRKITNAKRFATSAQIGLSSWMADQFRFDFGGEFNSNNFMKYDLRVLAKLTYLLWKET